MAARSRGSEPNTLPRSKKAIHPMERGSEKQTHGPGFADEVANAMTEASPLMRFLCGALGVPF
jgi:hypothetical protein